MDYHALAVDITDLERAQLRTAHACGVPGHEQSALIEIACGVDETGYFFSANDDGEPLAALWIGNVNVLGQEVPVQCLDEKEAQCRCILRHRSRR